MKQFYSHINKVIADAKQVCCCCGLFINSQSINLLSSAYSVLQKNFNSQILIKMDLDCCRYKNQLYSFCQSCVKMIAKSKVSKFDSANKINIKSYQYYPQVLKRLTIVEEAIIAQTHSIIFIMKLKLNRTSTAALYQ